MTSYINKFIFTLLTLGLLSLSPVSYAENAKTFGDYVIHYNAFRSDTISANIARQYGLPRSNNHILINIAVIKKSMRTMGTPTASKVEGFASNLNGQYKQLVFKEIKEGPAIYYLASTEISNNETLKFNIKVTPDGEKHPVQLRFNKRFFTR